jgi:hypothetical protein
MSTSWRAFTQGFQRQELMDQMMLRLGVDLVTAVGVDKGAAFVEARSKCRHCPHESECRVWLTASEARPVLPGFCPNGCFFQRCGLLGAHGLWRERRSSEPTEQD